MQVYSYLIDHDYGLAPNPFGKYCTLAVCKPMIRKSKNLKIGDWVLGTGSKALERTTKRKLTNKLIYAMKVTEIVTLEQYWQDIRFQYKKPMMNGSLVAMYGDNFYHKDAKGNWIQEDSAHCNKDGTCNTDHVNADTGGKNVLISDYFYYFGNNAQNIPNEFIQICHRRQGHKIIKPQQLAEDVVVWITNNFNLGINGNPLNWNDINQLKLSM